MLTAAGLIVVAALIVLTRVGSGTLTGYAQPRPGASGIVTPNMHVHVVVRARDDSQAAALDVPAPYRFSVDLSPGDYDVQGGGEQSQDVRVVAGNTVHVDLRADCG